MRDNNEVYRYIGSRLRFHRKQTDMMQRDVAALLGVSPAQYQKYESGTNKCPIDAIMILCRHYNAPLDSIIPFTTETTIRDATELTGQEPKYPDEVVRLIEAFSIVHDPKQRLRIIALVESMAAA